MGGRQKSIDDSMLIKWVVVKYYGNSWRSDTFCHPIKTGFLEGGGEKMNPNFSRKHFCFPEKFWEKAFFFIICYLI